MAPSISAHYPCRNEIKDNPKPKLRLVRDSGWRFGQDLDRIWTGFGQDLQDLHDEHDGHGLIV